MQICTWTELAQRPALRADGIEALQLTLGPGSLSHPAGTPGRKLNGLIAVTAGSCTYTWDTAGGSQTAALTAGGLIYLPRGAHYTLTLGAVPPVICRVSFRLYSGDEELLCAADPMPIAADGGAAVQRCVRMCGSVGADRSLRAMAQLFALLDEIGRMTAQAKTGRTAPALAHIRAHIDANTSVQELARMCYLSEAQFFRLFRKAAGCSPIRYRNMLRVARAKELLSDDELTVGAVASILGFESIYYFDRVFRQYTGESPGKYRGKREK